MNRVPDRRYSSVIGAAFDAIPPRIRERLSGVQFVCGVDPGFAGLHQYASLRGHAYADTPHCCYPHNLTLRPPSDRPTTIVLPTVPTRTTVVHELGHALHGLIGFDHVASAVTEYGRTNHYEAFAEAFTAWRFWGYGDEEALHADQATLALFAEVS